MLFRLLTWCWHNFFVRKKLTSRFRTVTLKTGSFWPVWLDVTDLWLVGSMTVIRSFLHISSSSDPFFMIFCSDIMENDSVGLFCKYEKVSSYITNLDLWWQIASPQSRHGTIIQPISVSCTSYLILVFAHDIRFTGHVISYDESVLFAQDSFFI